MAVPVLEAKSQLTDEKLIPLYILHLKYYHKRFCLPSDTHSSYCFKPFRQFKGASSLQRGVFVNLSQENSRIASK